MQNAETAPNGPARRHFLRFVQSCVTCCSFLERMLYSYKGQHRQRCGGCPDKRGGQWHERNDTAAEGPEKETMGRLCGHSGNRDFEQHLPVSGADAGRCQERELQHLPADAGEQGAGHRPDRGPADLFCGQERKLLQDECHRAGQQPRGASGGCGRGVRHRLPKPDDLGLTAEPYHLLLADDPAVLVHQPLGLQKDGADGRCRRQCNAVRRQIRCQAVCCR